MKYLTQFYYFAFASLPIAAAAQTLSLAPPPLPKPTARTVAPIPSVIEPLTALSTSLLHDFTLGIDTGSSVKTSRDSNLPSRAKTGDTTASLGFKVAERGFASISIGTANSSFRSRNSVANGAIGIDGSVGTNTYRFTGGYQVLPALALGFTYGQYQNSGAFQYNLAVPRSDTTGTGPTYSLFAAGVVPLSPFNFSMTYGVAYHNSKVDSKFANNVPPTQRSTFELMTVDLGVLVPVNEVLRLKAGITLNHTLSQSDPVALDRDWLAGSLGLTYAITRSIDVNAGFFSWLNSGKNDYVRANVGVNYKF